MRPIFDKREIFAVDIDLIDFKPRRSTYRLLAMRFSSQPTVEKPETAEWTPNWRAPFLLSSPQETSSVLPIACT
jgi:hypothetical protein